MIKRQLIGFLVRWAGSSLAIWLCYRFIIGVTADSTVFYIVAGLVFSVINSIIRPIVTLMTLPLSIVTLGLSTVIINVAMVGLTFWIVHVPQMSFLHFVLCSAIMIFINGLVNFLILPYTKK